MGLAWPGVDRSEDRHIVASIHGDVPARVFDFQYLVGREPTVWPPPWSVP